MMPTNDVKKIKKSFNDLFKYKKLNLRWTFGVVNHVSAHLHGFHVESWFTKQITPTIINNKLYEFTYHFYLKHLTKEEVKVFFDGQNYNYDLVINTLTELFDIGKNFNIYRNMTPIKNLTIENLLKKNNDPHPKFSFSSTKDINKLTLSSIFINKKNDKQLKKMTRYHLGFYLGEASQIHPIMTVFIPYTNNAEFKFAINLHPAEKESQIRIIENIKEEFKKELEKKLENLLRRRLKFKKDDLLRMTTDDKINYVPVLEMMKV